MTINDKYVLFITATILTVCPYNFFLNTIQSKIRLRKSNLETILN